MNSLATLSNYLHVSLVVRKQPMLARLNGLQGRIPSSLRRLIYSPQVAYPFTRKFATISSINQGIYPSNATEDTSPIAAASSPSSVVNTTHLSQLEIKNFALVDFQRISLQPGFNVITGESGSGKSVLIEALGQLLGSPASDDAVRPPATSAIVEGTIAIAPADQTSVRRLLLSLGLPQKSFSRGVDTLTIRREIQSSASGTRSKCFLNGSSTSLRVLREIGRALVDVNGQHASLNMKDGGTQLELLDRLAGLRGAVATLTAAWKELLASRAALRSLDELADENDRAALQELVDDVMASGLEPEEDVLLKRKIRSLETRKDAAERCNLITIGLGGGSGSGGGGMMDALHDVEMHVRAVLSQEERLKTASTAADAPGGALANDAADTSEEERTKNGGSDEYDEDDAFILLQEAMSSLHQARQSLDDAQSSVERYSRQYRFNHMEYKEVSERLQEVQKLMKQHDATSADELLNAAESAAAALDTFYQMEGRRDDLEADVRGKEVAVAQLSVEISLARRRAAENLKNAVLMVLRELAMPDATFDIKINWTPSNKVDSGISSGSQGGITISGRDAAKCNLEGTPSSFSSSDAPTKYKMRAGGLDSVEFLFAAGPEEPLKPLSSVASGGEAARVMLAIKAAPAFLLHDTTLDSNSRVFTSNDKGTSAEHYKGSLSEESECGWGYVDASIVVLDEIDSGVGSRLGQPIGRILRQMATGSTLGTGTTSKQLPGHKRLAQVLCVSHLPQVAAHAEHHICVRKHVDVDGRVVSTFDALSEREERLQEVAAMLGLPLPAAEELMQAAAVEMES
jgi:DNA repair ATPase RecN